VVAEAAAAVEPAVLEVLVVTVELVVTVVITVLLVQQPDLEHRILRLIMVDSVVVRAHHSGMVIGKVILPMLNAMMPLVTIVLLVEVLMEMVIIVDTIGRLKEINSVTKVGCRKHKVVLMETIHMAMAVFVTLVI